MKAATSKCEYCAADNNKIVKEDLSACVANCEATEYKNSTINTCVLCSKAIVITIFLSFNKKFKEFLLGMFSINCLYKMQYY